MYIESTQELFSIARYWEPQHEDLVEDCPGGVCAVSQEVLDSLEDTDLEEPEEF